MYHSFKQTSSVSDILFPTFKMPTVKLINECFFALPNYEYYHVTNDDTLYLTQDWDKILIEKIESKGWGFACGDDLLGGKCSFPVISGSIPRALGWLVLPGLTHLYGDIVWYYIGHELNKLYYVKDVIIEHKHFINHKSKKDIVYDRTNSKEMYQKDSEHFRLWFDAQRKSDIQRLAVYHR